MQIQTDKMGDIHHFAWRARFRNQTIYINKRDGERFGDWESLQCSVRLHLLVSKAVMLSAVDVLFRDACQCFQGASVLAQTCICGAC